MWYKSIDVPQHFIDAAALLGLGASFVDFNRRIFLKAFYILGIPRFKIVWEDEMEDEKENGGEEGDDEDDLEFYVEEAECGHD